MNHRLVLHISDNGKGCPGGNSSQDRSFGMKLIFLLAEQLDAKIEMMRQQGTHYRIEFSPSALID